jgi:bis(5'-adenosyl)-triphosphatase
MADGGGCGGIRDDGATAVDFISSAAMRKPPSLTAFLVLCYSGILPSQVLAFAFIRNTIPPSNPASPLLHMSANPSTDTDNMHFGKFVISSSHIFYRSPLSAAFVNLRPIVPGHVLVVPRRIVARMEDLTNDEYIDLWQSARDVQSMLKKHYQATGFNVAVQDGRVAGQSVPHVHVHILPRTEGDFERNDDVYDEMQEWAPRKELSKNKPTLDVPEDEDRKDRTVEQMTEEAAIYRSLL